jgi:hypothetical protein
VQHRFPPSSRKWEILGYENVRLRCTIMIIITATVDLCLLRNTEFGKSRRNLSYLTVSIVDRVLDGKYSHCVRPVQRLRAKRTGLHRGAAEAQWRLDAGIYVMKRLIEILNVAHFGAFRSIQDCGRQ